MSSHPTLVLSDEEDCTIVNQRLPLEPDLPLLREESAEKAVRRRRSLLRDRWRSLFVVLFVAAPCLSLLVVTVHQRRVSESLLRTIEALQKGRLAPDSAGPAIHSATEESQPIALSDVRPGGPEIEAASREHLELEAATLLITNDYGAALERYRGLSARFPNEEVFSDLVAILGTKLRCRTHQESSGAKCD